ncbi:MAG: hypothetical protein KC731_01085 [Myxococcales bacterium]|nr:hypothetical protein [Myxococcales bacterium]
MPQPNEKPVVETPSERGLPKQAPEKPVIPKIDQRPIGGGGDRSLPRRAPERPIVEEPAEMPVVGG